MHKPGNLERVKNILLVVLFLSTILLLYFYWENLTLLNFKFPDFTQEHNEETVPTVQEVMRPEEIVINFGGDAYTSLPTGNQELWNQGIQQLKSFSKAHEVTIEPITEEKYQEVMGLRSIYYRFFYEIPFSSFCDRNGIDRVSAFDQVDTFSCLGYSTGSPESLFLYDGKNDKYYRLAADQDYTQFEALIASVEQTGYTTYFPIGSLIGVSNRAIVPLVMESGLREVSYEPERRTTESEETVAFAQTFFGESFDFTRKITESKGTVIYMYGYGQRVLTLNTDGSAEYKEELSGNSQSLNFFESLDLALSYVSSHGSWKTNKDDISSPYLKKAESLEKDKNRGYRFTFGFQAAGQDIFYESGEAMVVEVFGNRVIYYKRDRIQPDQEALVQQASAMPGSTREAFFITNLLAMNYTYFKSVMEEAGHTVEGDNQELIVDHIAEAIDHVEAGYMRKIPEGSQREALKPAWVVEIGEITFFFDLYDAAPLGYTVSK